jgi:hypothetical protein
VAPIFPAPPPVYLFFDFLSSSLSLTNSSLALFLIVQPGINIIRKLFRIDAALPSTDK